MGCCATLSTVIKLKNQANPCFATNVSVGYQKSRLLSVSILTNSIALLTPFIRSPTKHDSWSMIQDLELIMKGPFIMFILINQQHLRCRQKYFAFFMAFLRERSHLSAVGEQPSRRPTRGRAARGRSLHSFASYARSRGGGPASVSDLSGLISDHKLSLIMKWVTNSSYCSSLPCFVCMVSVGYQPPNLLSLRY